MLPKYMLVDRSIRKEVCPSISLSLVKRIACNFTPDEFYPDHVPGEVLEVLNAESVLDRRSSGDSASSFPSFSTYHDGEHEEYHDGEQIWFVWVKNLFCPCGPHTYTVRHRDTIMMHRIFRSFPYIAAPVVYSPLTVAPSHIPCDNLVVQI
ncbi:hypothetical protein Droror1_Dr00009814 [Drosera rotundifolia]